MGVLEKAVAGELGFGPQKAAGVGTFRHFSTSVGTGVIGVAAASLFTPICGLVL